MPDKEPMSLFQYYFLKSKEEFDFQKRPLRIEWSIRETLNDTKSRHYVLIQEIMSGIAKEISRGSYTIPDWSEVKRSTVRDFVVPIFADKGATGENSLFEIDRPHSGLGRNNVLGRSQIFYLDAEKAKQRILAYNTDLKKVKKKNNEFYLIRLEENLL